MAVHCQYCSNLSLRVLSRTWPRWSLMSDSFLTDFTCSLSWHNNKKQPLWSTQPQHAITQSLLSLYKNIHFSNSEQIQQEKSFMMTDASYKCSDRNINKVSDVTPPPKKIQYVIPFPSKAHWYSSLLLFLVPYLGVTNLKCQVVNYLLKSRPS